MSAWLTDETWSRLDPHGARLNRRERLVVAVAYVVGALLLSVGTAAGQAGLILPHVRSDLQELTAEPGSRHFTEVVGIDATGSIDEQLIAVASATRGVTVSAVSSLPMRIAEGEDRAVRFDFTVTDCTAARQSHDLRVTLRFHRFWGTVSRTISQRPDRELPEDPVATVCR